MRNIKSFLLIAVTVLAFSMVSCTSNQNNGQVVVNATEAVGDHLNLQALGELVKSSKNPQEIEQKLNQPNGINNLDLNGDGQVDCLTVTEYGDGATHGYSICDVSTPDGKQEVANIQINTQNSTMTVNGNQNFYGSNNTYQSNFSTTDMLLLMWIMQPHYSYYASPYHYGYYGSYYRPYPMVSRSAYYSRPYVHTASTSRTYTTVTTYSTTVKSPNANAVSKTAMTRSVSSPSSSARSFSSTPRTTPVNTNGFKSSSSTAKPSSGNSFHSSSNSYSRPSAPPSHSYTPSRSSGSSFHSSGGGGRRCDVNAKDNIKVVAPMVMYNTLQSVEVATYAYKPKFVQDENLPSTQQIGFLAQNIQLYFPTAVNTDKNGFKTVDYYQMTAVNTQAIKDLIYAVQALQKDNASLRAKIAELNAPKKK